MDTSEQYMKMCREAREIQAMEHPEFSFIYRPSESATQNWSGIIVVHYIEVTKIKRLYFLPHVMRWLLENEKILGIGSMPPNEPGRTGA